MKLFNSKAFSIACFLVFACDVAQAQTDGTVAARVTLTAVDGFIYPSENQESILAQERMEHEDPSEGRGGYYARVSFTKSDNRLPVKVRISFMIDKDPLHPYVPLYANRKEVLDNTVLKITNENILDPNPNVNFHLDKHEPLSFYVYNPEELGGIEKIFAGVLEGNNPDPEEKNAYWEGGKLYREVTRLERTRNSFAPFEFFIPWELTNLYYVCPEKPAPFDVAIYMKVDIYDKDDKWIGKSTNVPVIYYSRQYEPQERESPKKKWEYDCDQGLHLSEEDCEYGIPKKAMCVLGASFPDKQKIAWGEDTVVFRKFQYEDVNNLYASERIENDTIQTVESAENYLSKLQAYCDSLDMKLEFRLPTEEEYCKFMNLDVPEDTDEDIIYGDHYTTDSVLVNDGLYILMTEMDEQKEGKRVLVGYWLPYKNISYCVLCGKILHEFQWSKFLTPIGLQRIRKKHPEIPAI